LHSVHLLISNPLVFDTSPLVCAPLTLKRRLFTTESVEFTEGFICFHPSAEFDGENTNCHKGSA
jgi:hypothetical protein